MLAETGESGMNRLSPVRCRQKERRIPRGVSIFSKLLCNAYFAWAWARRKRKSFKPQRVRSLLTWPNTRRGKTANCTATRRSKFTIPDTSLLNLGGGAQPALDEPDLALAQ